MLYEVRNINYFLARFREVGGKAFPGDLAMVAMRAFSISARPVKNGHLTRSDRQSIKDLHRRQYSSGKHVSLVRYIFICEAFGLCVLVEWIPDAHTYVVHQKTIQRLMSRLGVS